MGFFQDLLQGAAGTLFGSDYLRDYAHASKTFRPNAYQNAPKFKFLFHTYFDINPEAYGAGLATGQNFALLVKEVKLPSFSFVTHQLNQYNRKRIVQTKIKYEPITITFHDDNGNLINKLWNAYYTYYYKDGTKPNVVFSGARGSIPDPTQAGAGVYATGTIADYNSRNTYSPSETVMGNNDWGYIGETSAPSPGASPYKIPFFKNITVFGFNQHNFTAYTLVNPILQNFSHDTYNYDEGGGTMKNTMTVDYETVVYNEGAIDGRSPSDIVAGFGLESNYDRTPSPIAKPGANGTILGQGGLLDAAGGIVDGLARGDLTGLLGAVVTAGTAYNTYKNIDLKETASAELESMIRGSINNTPNRRNTLFDFLTPSSTPNPVGSAGSPTIGAAQSPRTVGGESAAGVQVNGG